MESVKSRLRRVRDSYKNGELNETVLLCEGILEDKADCYEACLFLGKAAYSLGDDEKAETAYVCATSITDSQPPGWQGLAEVYKRMGNKDKATPVLQKLVLLTQSDTSKNIAFKLRLAKLYASSGKPDEGLELLQDILDAPDLQDDTKLSALCQQADIQLMSQDSSIEARINEIVESKDGTDKALDENLDPAALRARVMGEFMEEALQANSPVCLTLKTIVQMVPPFPAYIKYYESFLLMYCKAIYSADPESLARYHLRVQTLEQCYKMIFGKSGGCCSPFPFTTALRLLEIKEEILGGQKQGPGQDAGTPVLSRRTSSTSGSLKMTSTTVSLHNLPPASDPDLEDRGVHTMWETRQAEMKIKVSSFHQKLELHEENVSPFHHKPFSTNSYNISTGATGELHSSGLLRRSISGSESSTVDFHGASRILPTFMRSYSLEVVRKLHRLGSGILPDSEDFIGSNSPLLLEVTERIGRRLIHMFPWEAESNVQLVLALRRRRGSSALDNDDNEPERRVTYFHNLQKKVHNQVPNWNEAALKVLIHGLAMGSHSAAGEYAAVELYLEEGEYQKALKTAQEAISYLDTRRSRRGYPMTQAYLTFRLLVGNAYLGLERLEEADEQFNKLLENSSEGETSFGWMVGSIPTSLRQAAHRGLAHSALARGDRVTARQKYEEVLGASMMGKAPLEHWAEAEYGWMLYEDGDSTRARNHLEAALELVEESGFGLSRYIGEYNFKLAKIYWSLGGKWRTEKSFAHSRLMQAAKSEGDFQADAFALLGKYYLDLEEDKQKARKCFQRALELDSAQDEAGNALMELLIEGGASVHKLLGFCKEMLSRDGDALWALEGTGRMSYALGDYQSAVVAFKTVLKKQLNDASMWEAIGAAYLGMGRLTASLKSFGRAVELDPNRLFALVQAGKLNAQTGDNDASLHCFNQALSIDANYPPALLGMAEALLTLCRSYLRMGVTKIAANLANEAWKLAERCTKFHGNLKSAWKVLGDVDFLHHAMPPVNDDAGPRGCRQTPQDFVNEAQDAKYKSFKRVQASRRSYAHALHLDPSEGIFWGDMAASCYQESRLQKTYRGGKPSMDEQQLRSLSEKLLVAGVCLSGTSVHLWEALGMCSSNPQLREYALHRALQLNPKNITSWVALAKVYQDCGDFRLAEDCLAHARSHDPEAVSIWEGMATLSTYQSPLELYEHAVGLGGSPNSFLGYAIHAVIHHRRGPPEIYSSARKAVENYPLLAPAHHALGMCEESRGLPFKALDAFETALKLLGGEKGFPEPKDWDNLGDEALLYLTAKARALCGVKRFEDARETYAALESAGKLKGLWAARVCFGKALWETGDLEESASVLAGVIQSSCGIHLKVAAAKTLVVICIVEKKLVECGGLVDNVYHQMRNSPDGFEYQSQLPDLYLALLAGAYLLGAKDLVCRFANSASTCVKGHGAQETTVVAKIYLIRHLALASAESTNTKAIHNRIRQAVHIAPWDPEVRMHLMKGSRKEASLILGLMQNNFQDRDPQDSNAGVLNMKDLKREIFRAKCSIRCEPTDATLWFQLAVLQFQLAQNLREEIHYRTLKLACDRTLHWIQVQENNRDEMDEQRCKSMQMYVLTLLSEGAMHMKEINEAKCLEYAELALDASRQMGPQHQGLAERHLGRVYIALGRQSEGESWLRKAINNDDRIAIIELGALLLLQGKKDDAESVLQTVKSKIGSTATI